MATTCARSPSPPCAPPSPSCRRTPCCSTTPSATTSPSAAPTPPQAEIEAAADAAQLHTLHRGPARRLRHAGRRARPQAVRRREAARGPGPRHPQAPAHPDPRRGHLGPGQRHRAGGPDGPARPRPPGHHAGRRPPPRHHRRRRRDPGAGPRPHRRARHPRAAAGAGRALRRPVAAAERRSWQRRSEAALSRATANVHNQCRAGYPSGLLHSLARGR